MSKPARYIGLRLTVWALLGLLVHLPTMAQGSKKRTPTTGPTSAKVAVPSYLTSEFEANLLKFDLAKNFRGHNFAEIYRKLVGIWREKSEFESTEEYTERIKIIESKNLFGTVQINSKLAFVISPSSSLSTSGASAVYDADQRKLKVKLDTDYGSLRTNTRLFGSDRSTDLQAFAVSTSDTKILRTYVGETGLGVKRRVTVGEHTRANIVFANCPASGRATTGLTTNSAEVIVPMSPTDAIDLKYNLGVLVIGQLLAPYSSYKRSLWASPKVNSPIEIWVDEYVLFMDVTELWLYSTSSGRVYAKVPECTLRAPDRYLSYNYLF